MASVPASSIGNAIEGARTIFSYDSPIINFIVGILVAYVVIYFITFYLGPVLFGIRPYRPWPIWARSMQVPEGVVDLNGESGMNLSAKVASAIQKNI